MSSSVDKKHKRKYMVIINQPNKAAYGPFDSMHLALVWLTNNVENDYTSLYVEIVPYVNNA